MLQLISSLLLLLWRTVLIQSACNDSSFMIGKDQFNVNHLKDHRPPSQKYSDKSNIYGTESSSKNYTFFNLADFVRGQKVDGHEIGNRCAPRSLGPSVSTNWPAACAPESNKDMCDNPKKPCYIALGSCDHMTAEFIDANDKKQGIHLKFTNGDYKGSSFVVTITCCQKGTCMEKKGLESPAIFKTSDSCPLDATSCAEISSPFGCDCETRKELDKSYGKKEFACDKIPKGLDSGPSTGTLLLIFFFVVVALYLIIGIAYNYKEGRRGEEMIPHVEMWKDLGGLIYDGFMYVKSCGEYREGVQYDTIG